MLHLDAEIDALAHEIIAAARARGLRIVTAESLTGGLIVGALTCVPGASNVVDRAFITYSFASKSQMLGVPARLVERCQAVSEEVARAMAVGALARSEPHAQLAVAVTGVAGPGDLDAARPEGLVHLAVARADGEVLHREARFGPRGRDAVRAATVHAALDLLRAALP